MNKLDLFVGFYFAGFKGRSGAGSMSSVPATPPRQGHEFHAVVQRNVLTNS